MLRAVELTKDYQMGEVTVHALVNASLEIYDGEFVVILGPSGSGKSTLLNILGGMDSPTSGRFFMGEKDISAYDDRKLTDYRRHFVGFVFQFYNLMSNLTARENVELATEISRRPLSIDEILENVGLTDRADHYPSQLSGGEQQRVSIARAIAKNPRMLLCDEPTGALDYATGISILQLLRDVNRNLKMTVVVITHNADIAGMGNRVLRMRSGEIVENTVNESPVEPMDIRW